MKIKSQILLDFLFNGGNGGNGGGKSSLSVNDISLSGRGIILCTVTSVRSLLFFISLAFI